MPLFLGKKLSRGKLSIKFVRLLIAKWDGKEINSTCGHHSGQVKSLRKCVLFKYNEWYSSKAGTNSGSSVCQPPAANDAEERVCLIEFKAKQSQNQVLAIFKEFP